MSPASGDVFLLWRADYGLTDASFHSINVPSEWGLEIFLPCLAIFFLYCFHSINVPSEWGQLTTYTLPTGFFLTMRFHSINVPSEWGLAVSRTI